jgi:hypothetical protein
LYHGFERQDFIWLLPSASHFVERDAKERGAMYKIRLLRGGYVIVTIDANTIDIAEIADKASKLEPQHGADDWEIVNEMGQRVVTKTRWNRMRHAALIRHE